MGNVSSSFLRDDSVNQQFLKAVVSGELSTVEELCSNRESNGLDINFRDKNEQTPLMWACYSGHIAIVNVLIANGANLTACDTNGYTALHHAVIGKQENVVKLLVIEYGGKLNINAKNVQGDSALHRGVHYSLKHICSVLIRGGAEINLKNNIGETPLDKARTSEIKKYLKAVGAKYNAKKSQIEGGQSVEDDLASKNELGDDDKLFIRRMAMKNDVIEWLKVTLSFPEYVDNFIGHGYARFDAIVSMKRENLKDIGVKMGHIQIILSAIEEYQESQQNLREPGMNAEDDDKENEMALVAKEYVFKKMDDDNGKVVCLDEAFNEVALDLDPINKGLVKKMKKLVESGKARQKDIKILISSMKGRDVITDARIECEEGKK